MLPTANSQQSNGVQNAPNAQESGSPQNDPNLQLMGRLFSTMLNKVIEAANENSNSRS